MRSSQTIVSAANAVTTFVSVDASWTNAIVRVSCLWEASRRAWWSSSGSRTRSKEGVNAQEYETNIDNGDTHDPPENATNFTGDHSNAAIAHVRGHRRARV